MASATPVDFADGDFSKLKTNIDSIMKSSLPDSDKYSAAHNYLSSILNHARDTGMKTNNDSVFSDLMKIMDSGVLKPDARASQTESEKKKIKDDLMDLYMRLTEDSRREGMEKAQKKAEKTIESINCYVNMIVSLYKVTGMENTDDLKKILETFATVIFCL
jgi:hypothetical protein